MPEKTGIPSDEELHQLINSKLLKAEDCVKGTPVITGAAAMEILCDVRDRTAAARDEQIKIIEADLRKWQLEIEQRVRRETLEWAADLAEHRHTTEAVAGELRRAAEEGRDAKANAR